MARALAARLAAVDPGGAAVVAGALGAPPFAPAARAASRLRIRLGDAGGDALAAGRLCLSRSSDIAGLVEAARPHAPLVLDIGRGCTQSASLADAVVVVAPPQAEPALAELLAESMPVAGREPLVVVNRARGDGRWAGRSVLLLPESHAGARLAAAGWEARGALGRAICGLAAICEAAQRMNRARSPGRRWCSWSAPWRRSSRARCCSVLSDRAYGAKSHAQRAADLAAISAARAMRDAYPRLFEPAVLSGGLPNPRHLSPAGYMALARAAAVRGASSNGAQIGAGDVSFPDAASFAPVRVAVAVRGRATLRLSAARPAELRVAARATAALVPGAGGVDPGTGGGYTGPLAYRQGKPMRPDVAPAFDRLAAAAKSEAGIELLIVERLPLRRRAGAPLRGASGSPLGRAPGREPPPLRHRARPGPGIGVRLARAQRGEVPLCRSATHGSRGTSATS